jgi:hypothetical protein
VEKQKESKVLFMYTQSMSLSYLKVDKICSSPNNLRYQSIPIRRGPIEADIFTKQTILANSSNPFPWSTHLMMRSPLLKTFQMMRLWHWHGYHVLEYLVTEGAAKV